MSFLRGNQPRVPPVSFMRQGSSSKPLLGPAVILLAAAVACLPLLIHGPSCGHDFDFHLISWFDALSAWRHGLLYPHWTPSANYGAGEPRFVFYPPLTWMLGAALGAVLPWSLVPLALSYLVLAGTGLATRALARQSLDEAPATLAGCAALFSGYALFTAYERTAFAEFAGGVWIPLVLLFLFRSRVPAASATNDSASNRIPTWKRALDGSTVPLALAVAAAWLSNPTVGVMACYTLAALALVVAWQEKSWAVVLRSGVGAALGMGLIAAYLLPAAWERRWVDILQVTEDPGQTLENNWLFATHADPALALHDAVLYTASMLVIGMTVVALGGALICWLRGSFGSVQGRRWLLPLALVPAAVLLLQFPFSRPLWGLPELRFLQFPWRWLIVLEAPMSILFAAAVWPQAARKWQRTVVVAVCAAGFAAMTACAGHLFFQSCDDEDSVAGMLGSYRAGNGFIGTNEYEPIGADNGLLAAGLPGACLVADPKTVLGLPTTGPRDDDAPPVWQPEQHSCAATFAGLNGSPEDLHLHATIPQSGFLILRLRSYPAWKVRVNGRRVEDLPEREDGLMAVPVPQGPVNLTVEWTTTPDVLLGRWISALAVLLLTALSLLERKCTRPRLS